MILKTLLPVFLLSSNSNALVNKIPEVDYTVKMGRVYHITGGDNKFACVFQYINTAWTADDLEITVMSNKSGSKFRCKPNFKHKKSVYGNKKATLYRLAKKTGHMNKFFGTGLNNLHSTLEFGDWEKPLKIINKTFGKAIKVNLLGQEGSDDTDVTGLLNNYGDAYACDSKWEHKEGSVCVPNVCECDNGDAVTKRCEEHGKKSCETWGCDAGYHFIWQDKFGGRCDLNVCKCDRGIDWASRQTGTPATGVDCPKHGNHKCLDCKEGLTLNESTGKCEGRHCYCYGGVASVGSECPNTDPDESLESCSSCTATGKHLGRYADLPSMWGYNRFVCKWNVCTCSHGEKTTGEACPVNNSEQCKWCYSSYALRNDGSCSIKTCYCANGSGSTGDDCIKEELHRCKTCNEGYSKGPSHWGEVSGYLEWHCI